MSSVPTRIAQARSARGEYRAGGTDLQQRLRSGTSAGPVVDLQGLSELNGIAWDPEGRARIGALTSIAALAVDRRVRAAYPALARSAAALATPQIRAMATLGGNLLQRSRCWYFRHPAVSCFKNGGEGCPARDGNHLFSSCFDLGGCVAPHPSTLGMALLAYEAQFETTDGGLRPITALYGDGSNARQDHQLGTHDLLTAVLMPVPVAEERGAYWRAISRAAAEWPLTEAVVRLTTMAGNIASAQVAVGGVAPIPLRRKGVEQALIGRPASRDTLLSAASRAADGATPLPMTAYKLDLLRATVLEALEHALQ
jgi:xanthine dehydrogenase YagS FAD-binding subunit